MGEELDLLKKNGIQTALMEVHGEQQKVGLQQEKEKPLLVQAE
jgi:hypothetical protein